MAPITQFPGFKLVTLLARQLSAPISLRIKEYARTHPRFSRSVCGRTAELYRTLEWQVRALALRGVMTGAAGGSRVPGRGGAAAWLSRPPAKLSPNEARDRGADILGEVIIFTIGSAIVVFEVNRQMEKQEMKEAAQREEWLALLRRLQDMRAQLAAQQRDIDRLRAALDDMLREDDDDDKPAPSTPATPHSPLPPSRSPTGPTPPAPHRDSPPPTRTAPSAASPARSAGAGDDSTLTPPATYNPEEDEKSFIHVIS